MKRLLSTKSVADKIVQKVLSNTGFIVAIAEIVGKLGDKEVDEHSLGDIKGSSTITSSTNLLFECVPSHPKRPTKRPSYSQWHGNLVAAVVAVVACPAALITRNWYEKDVI